MTYTSTQKDMAKLIDATQFLKNSKVDFSKLTSEGRNLSPKTSELAARFNELVDESMTCLVEMAKELEEAERLVKLEKMHFLKEIFMFVSRMGQQAYLDDVWKAGETATDTEQSKAFFEQEKEAFGVQADELNKLIALRGPELVAKGMIEWFIADVSSLRPMHFKIIGHILERTMIKDIEENNKLGLQEKMVIFTNLLQTGVSGAESTIEENEVAQSLASVWAKEPLFETTKSVVDKAKAEWSEEDIMKSGLEVTKVDSTLK